MAGHLAGFLQEKLINRKSYTDKQACQQIQNRIIEETGTKPVAWPVSGTTVRRP